MPGKCRFNQSSCPFWCRGPWKAAPFFWIYSLKRFSKVTFFNPLWKHFFLWEVLPTTTHAGPSTTWAQGTSIMRHSAQSEDMSLWDGVCIAAGMGTREASERGVFIGPQAARSFWGTRLQHPLTYVGCVIHSGMVSGNTILRTFSKPALRRCICESHQLVLGVSWLWPWVSSLEQIGWIMEGFC